jgi:hypothetical protein
MTIQGKGHRYTVELRVYGESVDPDAITRETGLQPCRTRVAGSRIGSQTYAEGMWAFDGGGQHDWESLEDGLVFVLDQLSGLEGSFNEYRRDHEVIWWCGHFQSSFDGGPVLSSRLLERLAAFGVQLFIDNYFSDSANRG